MKPVAYIANEFPSPIEPYVMDEIKELRRRGVQVICCSGKRVTLQNPSPDLLAFVAETFYLQPLSDRQLTLAFRQLTSDRRHMWWLLHLLVKERGSSASRRIRTLGHSLMGAALAEELASRNVSHIHAHHGYFASWMAMVAARLLGISFSLTLHGSDLLKRADLLSSKLRECRFCVTVSDFNRQYILETYPSVPAEKILVQRLGVDRVLSFPGTDAPAQNTGRRFCILSVGRLHEVKGHRFLIEACAELRSRNLDFLCWIVGEGPERLHLEKQIAALGLAGVVYLIGHVPRLDLPGYYHYADLVVMTSQSEGIPVVLMEAMAHEKLVLAPAITGIPELVEHQRTGFLYQPGSLPDFVNAVTWIQANMNSLTGLQRAAAASIAASYNRQRNLRSFADRFLARISPPEGEQHAHPVLQQVRLSL